MAKWRGDLNCNPTMLRYDFIHKDGRLETDPGKRADMSEVIRLFERIDPAVMHILVTAHGDEQQAVNKTYGRWINEFVEAD